MELYAKRTLTIGTENAFKIGPDIAEIEKNGVNVVKLNIGEPDFNLPDPIKNEIKRQLDLNNTHYCDPKGILSLREAIAEQIYTTRGLTVSPEQVVIFPGAKPAIGFCQQVYCDPGVEIIYPSPGFPIYESFIRYIGAIPVPIHLQEKEGFITSAKQLERAITPKTKLIILNFPSNPTGGVATQQQLEALASVILKKTDPNLRVFSDEIYENILFDGIKQVSIASLPSMASRTIISSGFSKSYAWTGGRIGYAIFPTIDEAEIFKNLNINYFSCVPPYNQMAAIQALKNKDVLNSMTLMVKAFEERRNFIVPALNAIPGMTCQMPLGAFYVFPNIKSICEQLRVLDFYEKMPLALQAKTSPSTLFQAFALHNHHVAVLDRRSFGMLGSENEHFIRISFAADLPILKEGIIRLAKASQDNLGFERFFYQHFRTAN